MTKPRLDSTDTHDIYWDELTAFLCDCWHCSSSFSKSFLSGGGVIGPTSSCQMWNCLQIEGYKSCLRELICQFVVVLCFWCNIHIYIVHSVWTIFIIWVGNVAISSSLVIVLKLWMSQLGCWLLLPSLWDVSCYKVKQLSKLSHWEYLSHIVSSKN